MNSLALTLVLVSACLHAGWNLLGKKQQPSLALFTLMMLAGGIVFSPWLLIYRDWLALPLEFWGIWLLSGAFQGIYMAGLAWAYARGDVSVLYPLVRGLPVILIPWVGLWLGGYLYLSVQDGLGMFLIFAACVLLPLRRLNDFHWRFYMTPALGFMLLAVLGTVGYSWVDKQAIDLMQQEGMTAFSAGMVFMVLQAWSASLWMLPSCFILTSERRALRQQWRNNKRVCFVAGAMVLATYGLVLIAMGHTQDVSYVVALRQASIPIGALLAVFWLKEVLPPIKWIALSVMMLGLVLVALP